MDRRVRKTAAARPLKRAQRRQKQNSHIIQLLLLILVAGLLIGPVVVWKVCNNQAGWREWSTSMRSGMFGMHGDRSGRGSEEDLDKELEEKSIRFHGDGYADLGQFSVGRYDMITGTTLTVNFQLKGMTPCKDKEAFNTFMHENEHAFHARVTQAVRDCRARDITDATALSKKVVARVNRAFSGRFLESAELADFDVFESVGTYSAEPWQSGEAAAAGM